MPVSCSLISQVRREETTAWPSAVMIWPNLQNDGDVLLLPSDVRASSTLRFADVARRLGAADVERLGCCLE
jgi:hypothetical protein